MGLRARGRGCRSVGSVLQSSDTFFFLLFSSILLFFPSFLLFYFLYVFVPSFSSAVAYIRGKYTRVRGDLDWSPHVHVLPSVYVCMYVLILAFGYLPGHDMSMFGAVRWLPQQKWRSQLPCTYARGSRAGDPITERGVSGCVYVVCGLLEP